VVGSYREEKRLPSKRKSPLKRAFKSANQDLVRNFGPYFLSAFPSQVMDISLDKFYMRAFGVGDHEEQQEVELPPKLKEQVIPEKVLAKIAFSVSAVQVQADFALE